MSSSTHTPNADRGQTRTGDGKPTSQAFHEAFRLVGQLRSYIGYYVSSRLDQAKLTLRTIMIWAALGVVGLITMAAVVVMAVVQILGGIAGGIAQIFPRFPWIGNIITGLVVLAIVFFGVRWGMRFIGRMSRTAIVAKYEAYKRDQRQQYGQSVDDRTS